MANTFVKRVAEDLLHLEINTIVKSAISGTKMPDSNREALYDIASDYHFALINLGMQVMPPEVGKANNGFRGEEVWRFGGAGSFNELAIRAGAGIKWIEDALQNNQVTSSPKLDSTSKMLERIRMQSLRMLGIFYKQAVANGVDQEAVTTLINKTVPPGENMPAQSQSKAWNNDITRYEINLIPDLSLDVKEIMTVKKAWDIGVEEIMLQTIVGIDGDVTTRAVHEFADNPNPTLLGLHNDATQTSISFWYKIVDVVVKIAGDAFSALIK